MKPSVRTLTKSTLFTILVSMVLGMMAISVFSGFPPRHFAAAGGLGAATIYVSPQDSNFTSTKPIDLKNGTTFDVNIRIANATLVAGWQIDLTYDKRLLNTTEANVSYATDMIFPLGTYSPIAPVIGPYNGTHNFILMTASTIHAVEYNATDAGLMTITFTIIADPDPCQVLSCMLYLQHESEAGTFGTWTIDTEIHDNELWLLDGYYENRNVPLPSAWATMCSVWTTDAKGNPKVKFSPKETVYIRWDANGMVNMTVYAPDGVTTDQKWTCLLSSGVFSFAPSHGMGTYEIDCTGAQPKPIAIGTFLVIPQLPFLGSLLTLVTMLAAVFITKKRRTH